MSQSAREVCTLQGMEAFGAWDAHDVSLLRRILQSMWGMASMHDLVIESSYLRGCLEKAFGRLEGPWMAQTPHSLDL